MSLYAFDLHSSLLRAVEQNNQNQAMLERALALNKQSGTPAAAQPAALGALAHLAGRQRNSLADQLAAEVAMGLLHAFAEAIAARPHDPVVVAGDPPLTRSMLDCGNAFIEEGLGIPLRSHERRIFERLIEEIWKRGVREEIASVLALVGHAANPNRSNLDQGVSAEVLKQFLELPWNSPIVLWAQAVGLRFSCIGQSNDPELDDALREGARLTSEVKMLTRELAASRDRETKVSEELTRTRTELKSHVEQETGLRARLDEILTAPPVDGDTLEHRLRVALVRNGGPWISIDPHVPQKKIVNARMECQVPAAEKILALIDLTLFGSAKNAIVFGTDAIYHHSGVNRCSVSYAAIGNMTATGGAEQLKFRSHDGSEGPAERAMNVIAGAYSGQQFKAVLVQIAEACAVTGCATELKPAR